MINSGDIVEYASAAGPRRGQVIDVRCGGNSAGVWFTYIVGLDGVHQTVAVTDRSMLTRITE